MGLLTYNRFFGVVGQPLLEAVPEAILGINALELPVDH
jgi:hypothetical protein